MRGVSIHIKPESLGFYIKCLFAFYKKRESMPLKKICYLLEMKSSSLLKKAEFRELVRRGAIEQQSSVGNPNQRYHVNYFKIKDLVADSDLVDDLIEATNGKISKVYGK